MEKANLPIENAREPDEEAFQPLDEVMTPRLVGQSMRKLITFVDDTDTEKSPSQKSSSYKDILSQPAPGLSHRQKLLWLQKRRTEGLWVQCDDCNRWRFLSNVLDSYDLPKKWYCRMNPDTTNADCSVPETPIRVRDEEDLIHSEYSAGSVVWARMAGWPWWPAMVDDCPDTEQFYWLDGFSDIPTHYNVVFFDSIDVTRGWISPENLKPYTAYKNSFKPFLKDKKYKTRLRAAVAQADDATKLPLIERLEKYSFIAKYKGALHSPKKVNKKEIKKHMKILKRKYNIEFENSDDEDDDVLKPQSPVIRNKNVIVLGTPKNTKRRAGRAKKAKDETDTAPIVDKVIENKPIEKPLEKGPIEKQQENAPADSETQNTTKALEANEETEPDTETCTNDVFKRPNSLAVQIGSNNDSATVEEPFDDDTSKTYVPEKESEEVTQLTQTSTVVSEITNFRVTIASPTSDDFDF